MPQKYTIYPESLMTPNQFSPYLTVYFRRGVESRNPIASPILISSIRHNLGVLTGTQFPASGLQLSFEQPDDHREVFTGRVTACDVRSTDSGLCTVDLPKDEIPKYAIQKSREDSIGEIVVKLHAWKGEVHLGVWEVGRLSGKHAYTIVG